ncbi:hypothetical protein MADA3029_270054 [Vibrio nigripulchritudo MADA3029]|nr:hypothetical protein VIBNIMADA3020_420054 [Vibrio nigripulchritudo MADA3020]CCN56560.1 hypothetical protein VIBNIMADA3021_970055 [Vibrio nigripulchritudo MADA3021]CCN58817.1 hypothetical protein MADA3029_270054 [Vibrio nigripulchritudo MADA3029]
MMFSQFTYCIKKFVNTFVLESPKYSKNLSSRKINVGYFFI